MDVRTYDDFTSSTRCISYNALLQVTLFCFTYYCVSRGVLPLHESELYWSLSRDDGLDFCRQQQRQLITHTLLAHYRPPQSPSSASDDDDGNDDDHQSSSRGHTTSQEFYVALISSSTYILYIASMLCVRYV